MTGFSDAAFDDGCVMDELQARSFFPYSGEHGDLDQWGESPATA